MRERPEKEELLKKHRSEVPILAERPTVGPTETRKNDLQTDPVIGKADWEG